ncbi:hypothetical protein Btru_028172 [Bulinus truncatus]|nr:hypothetical protein Btru_028172 [Bulinus truncatus]
MDRAPCWLKLALILYMLLCILNSFVADSVFIFPSNQIANLASRGQITEIPYCSELDCRPSFNSTTCVNEKVCYEKKICNGRISLPLVEYPLKTWRQASNSSACTVSVKTMIFPTIGASKSELVLSVNGSISSTSPCYFQRTTPLDPVFSLVYWLSADCRNCSILEMSQSQGKSINIRIVNNTLVCLDSDCTSFSSSSWSLVMMTLQINNNKLNIFMNKTKLSFNYTNRLSAQLDLFIGSREVLQMNNVFELLYIQYYPDALTNDELSQLWSGMVDPLNNFPECQCPASFIELSAKDSNVCTDGNKTYPRFNRTIVFYSAKVILDSRLDLRWASPELPNTTLIIIYNSTFLIDGMHITFSKDVPKTVLAKLSSGAAEGKSQELKCLNKTCSLALSNWTSTTNFLDYNLQVADKIEIDLSGSETSNSSFILTNITILGRCDCHGNADSCNEVNSTFVCSCKAESHSVGNTCNTCLPSYYRSSDRFSCPERCQCNSEGVVNVSYPCDQLTGKCLCKLNVEGRMCDTCKPLTYNLSSTNSLGCTHCSCSQPGALSCSNITGVCSCKANTVTPSCDKCQEKYYGITYPDGCKPCNCSILGTVNQSMSCNTTSGQCLCKRFVEGLHCDSCKSGFYYLEAANIQGCMSCNCHTVGSDSLQCDRQTGQCPCRAGVITDKFCSPKIESMDPLYGPLGGGTHVSVQGRLLGSDTSKVFVFFDDVPQNVLSVDDHHLVFTTVSYNITALLAPILKVSWEDASIPVVSGLKFTFKPNPVIFSNTSRVIKTFVSGGSAAFIYGENLQSVMYPRLEMINKVNQSIVKIGSCRHNPSNIICAIPDATDLYKTNEDIFQLRVVLDGLIMSDLFNVSVVPDPVFHNMGNIRFQYPFEDTITLNGQGLTAANNIGEYSVYLGVVSCAIKSVSDTAIVCQPAESPLSGETKMDIVIRIGNIKRIVGTFEYLKLHETTNFIIIICCVSIGLFLIAAAVVIFLYCRRYRKNHQSTTTFANVETKSTAVDHEYIEPLSVDAQPKQNGGGELVRMETVIKEPKLGFVNSQAEENDILDEFLEKIEASLREEIKNCFIGGGHFTVGRTCYLKGQLAMLTDGSLQNSSSISGQKVTIKTLIKPLAESLLPPWASLALSECLRLKRHKHIHVLTILGVGVDREKFHILYPHMSQNVLKTIVANINKKFSARDLLRFCQQAAEGLSFLASKDITHKDVAARNCMLDMNDVVKLSDASFSWDFFPDEYVYDGQRERYLPLRWMAPESLSDGYYDKRTDVWSLAVLIWELMTRGCLPFQEVPDANVKQYIVGGYILGKPDTLLDPMYELMCQCWSPENECRPSIGEITRRLGEIIETDDDVYENLVSYSNSPKHIPLKKK